MMVHIIVEDMFNNNEMIVAVWFHEVWCAVIIDVNGRKKRTMNDCVQQFFSKPALYQSYYMLHCYTAIQFKEKDTFAALSCSHQQAV